MPNPFSNSIVIGRPSWGAIATVNGNFSLVTVTGAIIEEEVGYGEGGYGEGGYDAPAIIIPGSSLPNWSIVAVK